MSNTNKNDRAFPIHGSMGEVAYEGITPGEYAAIKLKVPDSETAWLDDMIRKSLRNDLAAKAMQGEIACQSADRGVLQDFNQLAIHAYQIADAMMKASEQ